MTETRANRAHPDKELVERMLAGDRTGFDEFFAELVPRIHRFVRSRFKGDPEEIKEIVQSSVCIAIDRLETYRGDAALFSWICGISHYEILAHLKGKRAQPLGVELVEESSEVQASLESLCAIVDGPEAQLVRGEVASLVHRTLDRLSSRHSRALEWKYCEGLSVREIGERLQIGSKAAESTLTRARIAFREAFDNMVRGPLTEPAYRRAERGKVLP